MGRYRCVGWVRRVLPGDAFEVVAMPGKVALVISDPYAGDVLGYFDERRRPPVGSRIGVVRGTWIMRGPAAPQQVPGAPPGTVVISMQFQMDVGKWSRISEDYDEVEDELGLR